MRAGERACACPECGVICQGQFDGCPDVWARGPRPIALTVAPAIEAPRVRALAAGSEPANPRMTSTAPAARSNGNGNGNGSGGYAGPPPTAGPEVGHTTGSRTEVLRWFEDAFDELRNELHALASTVTRQQAMLAELLDSREAELRVVMVAESLPEMVGEAAAKALADQSDGLAEVMAGTIDDFRASIAAADVSNVAVMDAMRELLRRVELTAEINAEEARADGADRLEALKGSVGRQLRPVTAAVVEIADYVAAAEEREAARTRALKASVTRQLQPLAATVEAAMERSDRQLAEIRARLDALGAPKVRAPRKSPAAPAKKPPAKKAAKKAPAPEPEPGPELFFDYDELPAPAPPVLLNRRRPAARPRGSGPPAGA